MSRTVVITGASQGLGAELAETFVKKGFLVIGLARSESKLDELAQKLGAKFKPIRCDITNSANVSKAFETIRSLTKKIDVLINNAAVFKMKPFRDCTVDDISAILDTNLKGTLYCTHAALPAMSSSSRIINVASVAATHGIAGQVIYCASKYGMDGFAEALQLEVQPHGIFVSTIYPGGIDTPLWNSKNPYPGRNQEQILKTSDVVNAIEYICDLPKHVVLKKLTLFPVNESH